MKRVWVFSILVLFLVLAGWWFFEPQQKQLNILVVSNCSLRHDRLGVYNPEFKKSPLLDQWAKQAFIFDNAVAERPWQNFSFEASDHITKGFLRNTGYALIRRPNGHHFHVPPVERTEHGEWYWDEDAILHYQKGFADLKAAITEPRNKPFFIFAHLKYMHYPYLDPVNMGENDWAKLSPRSQELLNTYRKTPEQFEVKLPMIEVMLNSFDLVKRIYGVEGQVLSVAGIISDPSRNKRWREAPGFADDLRLVTELYDLKMEKFDRLAYDVVNLYGNRRLQNNTIVIFTGDHGEALMEHGVLGHSVNVYEEMIRYPLIVKFPGQKESIRVPGQTNHEAMAKLVVAMMDGRVNQDNFVKFASGSDYVVARNCTNTIQTVRFQSEWKLIKNLDSGRTELYNLKQDPQEMNNLSEQFPDMAWRLEEYLQNNQALFQRTNKFEGMSYVCPL